MNMDDNVDFMLSEIGNNEYNRTIEVEDPPMNEYWPPKIDETVPAAPQYNSQLRFLSDLVFICAALGCIVVVAYYLRQHDVRCAGCPDCFPWSRGRCFTAPIEESSHPADSTQHHLLTLKRPGIDVDCLECDTDSGAQTPVLTPLLQSEMKAKKMIPIRQRAAPPYGSETKDLFGTSPSPRHYLLEQGGLACSASGARRSGAKARTGSGYGSVQEDI